MGLAAKEHVRLLWLGDVAKFNRLNPLGAKIMMLVIPGTWLEGETIRIAGPPTEGFLSCRTPASAADACPEACRFRDTLAGAAWRR
jgi:hypothetical protein